MKRYDLTPTTLAFLTLLLAFFGLFLFYPVSLLLKGAFLHEGHFSLRYVGLLVSSPLQRESLLNSLAIAALTTAHARSGRRSVTLASRRASESERYDKPERARSGQSTEPKQRKQ